MKNIKKLNYLPRGFCLEINVDTTLAPNVIFREVIEISGNRVDSRASFKDWKLGIKKSEKRILM